MKKQTLLLALIFLSLSISAFAQKTTLNIPVKAYVDLKTANHFGGKLAIQDSINKQFQRMNQFYNAETRLNNYYNFYVSSFQFYTDNEANDSTLYFSDQFVTSYLKIVYDNFVPIDTKGYNSYLQTIIFSHDGVNGKNGTMFGRIATQTLIHEFGHSRSAIDIYAGTVDGTKNSIVTGLGYRTPLNSVMNNLYVESGWDTHSIYLMNTTASTYGVGPFSGNQHNALVKNAFPQNITVRVKDAAGNAVPGANVKFYGVEWYFDGKPNSILNSADEVVNTNTNASGLLTFNGATANPFNPGFTGDDPTQYFNFLVAVTANGQTRYEWLPIFAVQNSFISGASTHYVDVVVKTSTLPAPNKVPYADILNTGDGQIRTAPADIWVVIAAFDLDGTIDNVKIYDGTTFIGYANYEPWAFRYSFQLINLPIGKHYIKAVVTDNQAATTETLPLLVELVPAAPSVSLSSPTDNSTFTTGNTITINANVTSGAGTVTKVEFYKGATKLGEDATAPYSYAWTNVPAGATQLTARVYDNLGSTGVAYAINITVNPLVTCTDPAWNSATVYVAGNKVSYLGRTYQARYWTQNNQPNLNTGSGQAWSDLGVCGNNTSIGINGPSCVNANTAATFTLNPEANYSNTSWWTSGNATIQVSADGKTATVTFAANVSGTFTLSSGTNYSSSPWYKEYTKTISVGGCASRTAESESIEIVVSPNPFHDIISVSSEKGDKIISVTLLNTQGQELLKTMNPDFNAFVNGENLNAGIYILQIETENNSYTKRIIKTE